MKKHLKKRISIMHSERISKMKQLFKTFHLLLILLIPAFAYAQTGYDLTDTTFVNRFDEADVSNADFTWSGDSWAGITFTQQNGELTITNFGKKYANTNLEFTDPINIEGNPVMYFEAKSTQDVNIHMRMIDTTDQSTWDQFTVDFIGDGEYHAYAIPLIGSWADLSILKKVNFSRSGQETVADCDVTFRYMALGIRERYVLDMSQTPGGTVDMNPTGGIYDAGTTVTLTATPNETYVFDGWSGSVIDTSSEIELVMNEDKNLMANFSIPGSFSGYFVSQEAGASDSNPGTKASPFRTVQKAASVAAAGDTVYVRAGVYRETITPQNSGTAFDPIVYMPYNGEEVTISGTDTITGWELHEGNIYKAPMAGDFFTSSVNMTDQVFADGQMMNLARWPNTSLDVSHPVKAVANKFISKDKVGNVTTGVMEDEDIPAGDYTGAELFFQPNNNAWSWAFTGTVTDVSGARFTFESFSSSGQDFSQDVYHPQSRYYFFNKYSLLDTTGEWYHDKTEGYLYLWLPGNENPADHIIEAKKRDYGFNLSNLSYIEIRGFKIFGCNITTDDASGGDGVGYTEDGSVRYPWRGAGSMATSHNITIDGIECLYPSHSTDVSGHFFFQYGGHSGIVLSGQDHTIQNSVIRYSFANAISILGYRHKILNNLIEDIDYSGCEYGAIGQSGAFAYDCEMAYNTIRRTGRSGIRLGFHNSDPNNLVSRVHHNEISQFMLQDNDGGGIYHGGNGNFVRMDHNVIHDGKGFVVSGIYPDWGKNYIYDHNLIYNVWSTFHFTHTYDDAGINNYIVYNNTTVCTNNDNFVFGPFNFVCSGDKEGIVLKNNIGIIHTPPGRGGYKVWSDNATFDQPVKSNNLFDEDPLFVEYPNNFQLQAGSAAIDAGEPMEAVTRDGVTIPPFNDPVSGAGMDIGAFEFGLSPFQAGSSLDTVKGSVIKIYAAGKTGDESLSLMILNNPVAVFSEVGGNTEQGVFETFTYQAKGKITPEMVKVWFQNFDTDKELRIDKISIDGIEYQSEDVICSCTSENTEYLTCSGYFLYQLKPTYKITIIAENGHVEMDPPGGLYNEGTEVTITAVPDEGYVFSNWSGNASGNISPKLITVRSDRTITANFTSTVGIQDMYFDDNIRVFPNPVQDDVINIELNRTWQKNIHVDLINTNGVLVFNKSINQSGDSFSVNISEMSKNGAGTYLLRISDGNKTSKRIIILK